MPSIPRDDRSGQPDTGEETVILGVDTHKDFHVAFIISTRGQSLGHNRFPTTATGYRQLLNWARGFGTLERAGVEGTSSYGIAITRALRAAGISVLEVNRPDKANRRRRGKTDVIDAEAAARAVLSGRASAIAKTGDGAAEILRMLKTAKDSAIKSRSQAINQLKAIIVRTDPALRESLTGLSNARLVRRCAELDCNAPTTSTVAAAYTLRSLARRILALTEEVEDLNTHIAAAITTSHPALLDCYGVGPAPRPRCSSRPATTPTVSATRHRSRRSAVSARSKPPPAKPAVDASTAAETAKPTPPSTPSSSPDCAGTQPLRTTLPAAKPRAKPGVRPSDASNAMLRASSTGSSPNPNQQPPHYPQPLDIHRGIKLATTYRGGFTLALIVEWLKSLGDTT
nr:transposase [Nocardia wallacei]